MKLNWNLSLTAKPAQRCAQAMPAEISLQPVPPNPVAASGRKNSAFNLLATRQQRPVRIPPPIITVRPVFRGNQSYLRALRAAEMVLWNADLKFPAF